MNPDIGSIMRFPPGRALDHAVAMALGWQVWRIQPHAKWCELNNVPYNTTRYALVPPSQMREENPITLQHFPTEAEAHDFATLPAFSTSAQDVLLLDRVPWFSQRWASLEQEFKVSGLSPAVPAKIYFSFNRGLTATAKCKALLYWLDGQVVWR